MDNTYVYLNKQSDFGVLKLGTVNTKKQSEGNSCLLLNLKIVENLILIRLKLKNQIKNSLSFSNLLFIIDQRERNGDLTLTSRRFAELAS